MFSPFPIFHMLSKAFHEKRDNYAYEGHHQYGIPMIA